MANEQEFSYYLYQTAKIQYPLSFLDVAPHNDGLILTGDDNELYFLKKYEGRLEDLSTAVKAEKYLHSAGLEWVAPTILLSSGKDHLKYDGKTFYLKRWFPKEMDLPFKWQLQFGSEVLATIHKKSEGFKLEAEEDWQWPDWIKLFQMARDTMYELHTVVVEKQGEQMVKYFNPTAELALIAMDEAINHLKRAGYPEQRTEGMRKGYVSLTRVPGLFPGDKFDMIGRITPDLPACSLGAFLCQIGDWKNPWVINDVVDLISSYNQIRELSIDELELVKGFMKFPWLFWNAAEEYFLQKDGKKNELRYTQELKAITKSMGNDFVIALQEL